jgi:uncharacterized repeat protein (TIGR02543 family)
MLTLKTIMKRKISLTNNKWLVVLLSAFISITGCKKVNEAPGLINPCPVVVSTDPMDKAVDVALNKVISATFNTNMDTATLNNLTFVIRKGGKQVPGTVAPTATGTTFTFKPDEALLPFVQYSGTITTGAKDKYGTSMIADYAWSFTTIPLIRLSSNPAAGGTTTGAGTFAQGSSVTVTATPNAGYTFTNWKDSGSAVVASTSSSYQFTMAGNRTLVANFTLIPPTQYGVTLSSNPAAGGSTFGQGSYNTGSVVTIIESPNPGYTFVNWTENGIAVSTNSSYQFTITGNRAFVANFSAVPALQYSVFTSSNPITGGTTAGSGNYTSGASVTVSANPNSGYSFVNWTENGTTVSTSAAYTFTLTGNRTLTANFALNSYTLTVISSPAAGGSVTKNPNQASYSAGSTVQLTAVPNSGYTFTGWTGNASGSVNPLTVTMNSNKTITANFTTTSSVLFSSIFGAFGGSAGLTNQGIFTVVNNGAIGTTAASSLVTGFHDGLTGDVYTETPLNVGLVTGGIYSAPPPPGTPEKLAIATQALSDANAFYISISPANRPATILPTGEVGGLTLTPGTYRSPSGTLAITNGNLTLDGQGNSNAVWVFQASSSLTVGIAGPTGARSVILTNGAQAKNIYWYVGTAATINGTGGGIMAGTIIASSGVSFSTAGNTTQTVLDGRAISLVASVTMVNTTINVPN